MPPASWIRRGGLALAIAAVLAPARASHAQLAFQNITGALGMGDTSHGHFGITVVDIDADGFVDVYYANGIQDPLVQRPPTGTCPSGTPVFPPENHNTLYMNNGDGTFALDSAPAVGLDDAWFAMRNVFADYDNDGDRDLLSHNFLASPLYECTGTVDSLVFVDASASSELSFCLTNGTGASWVDLNHDGYLDLYGGEYDEGRAAAAHLNKMFLNDGDGTFTDVSTAAGIDLVDNPMGISFCDYDNDGDQDFFVTNSHEAPTRLYRHDGVDGQTGVPVFVDVAPEAGVAVQDGVHRGVGIGWGDYDNDGRMDMIFSREGDSRLWHNDGPDSAGIWRFSDASLSPGLQMKFTTSPYGMWGGNFLDLDNDGWLDLVLCNRDQGGANQVYRNNADGTWSEMAAALGMDTPPLAQMGVVGADIENDGDLDIFLCSHKFGQPNLIFRNDSAPRSWIQFRLTGTVSNLDAVGARIRVTAEIAPGQTVTQTRDVVAGTGFFSDVPRVQTFGLGSALQADQVTIEWPSGITQALGTLAVGQRHDVTESAAVDAPVRPAAAGLLFSPVPNPFRGTTTVRFGVEGRERVRVEVLDVAGRRVRTLADRTLAAGMHETRWNGRDASGAPVPAGVYFVHLKAGDRTESARVLLLR